MKDVILKGHIYLAILLLGVWYFYTPQTIEEPVGGVVTLEEAVKPQVVEESTFAEVDKNGVVTRVIVADQSFIDSGRVGDPKNWVKTSSKGTIRKNYAGIGYTYDKVNDVFIPPKTTETSIFNTAKAMWEYPVSIERILMATSTDI